MFFYIKVFIARSPAEHSLKLEEEHEVWDDRVIYWEICDYFVQDICPTLIVMHLFKEDLA